MINTKKISANNIMKYRGELFGFAALWIVMFHICNQIGLPFGGFFGKACTKVIKWGNRGVDLFLFLSAIGLCVSMQKNTIKDFYKNRIRKVVVPVLICCVLYFGWEDLYIGGGDFLNFILNITTINFWIKGNGPHPHWYIALILILYIIFPLVYKLDVKTKHISTVGFMGAAWMIEYAVYACSVEKYDSIETALSRAPYFFACVIVAQEIIRKKDKCRKIGLWFYVFGAALMTLMPKLVGHDFPKPIGRYVGAIFILCVAMIYVWARENMPNLTKIFAVLFQWCGKYSLEVYLIHVLVIRVILMYNWFPKLSVLAWYFVITGLSFVLAVALSACTKLLNKKISI